MSGIESITQSTGGKVAIGVVLAAAIFALGWQAMHMGDGEKSRDVPKAEAISDAQQQIDAINKMTNLTADQKKSMIAHFQGQIDTANGSGGKAGAAGAGQGGH